MVHPHDSFTESKRCLDLRRLKNKLESTVKTYRARNGTNR